MHGVFLCLLKLLFYGPGDYKFTDFLIVGLPLSLICMYIVVFLAVFIWE